MILYVNGDSHTAAAEAVTPFAFAEDDPTLGFMGRVPHPKNLEVSWGKTLSKTLRAGFHCGAESGSSNARIIRTTKNWIDNLANKDQVIIIIQWSTWEREEWLHNGVYLQVGSSGTDHVPQELQEKYRHFVVGIDWKEKTQQAHLDIWNFHLELNERNLPHVFFNGNNDFSAVSQKFDWGKCYIGPYDSALTYHGILQANNISTVLPNSWHYGPDGHSFWHRYILNYLMQNSFL